MTNIVYNLIYKRSLGFIMLAMAIFTLLWIIMRRNFTNKLCMTEGWKRGNRLLLSVGIMGIWVLTIVDRESIESEIIFRPFQRLIEARKNKELYRSMFMNVFLFFPIGLTLPCSLPEKCKRKVVISILCAIVFSVFIEFVQYYYRLGRAETDDVICNTLGCAIGTLSYSLSEIIMCKRNNICKKERDT